MQRCLLLSALHVGAPAAKAGHLLGMLDRMLLAEKAADVRPVIEGDLADAKRKLASGGLPAMAIKVK